MILKWDNSSSTACTKVVTLGIYSCFGAQQKYLEKNPQLFKYEHEKAYVLNLPKADYDFSENHEEVTFGTLSIVPDSRLDITPGVFHEAFTC